MIRAMFLAIGYIAALALPLAAGANDESVVPPTPHQEQVLRGAQQTDTPSRAVGRVECGMPTTPHQEQVLREQRPQDSGKMQPDAQFPATGHQQQVLRGTGGEEGAQVVPTENGMPASPHQQHVLKTDKVEQQPGGTC